LDFKVGDFIEQARDAMTVRRVFGEPIHEDGVVVVPVAAVRGGAGGGAGGQPGEGEGGGGGFGVMARPVGAYVIRGDQVEWRPAIDTGRLAMAGLVLAGLAVFTVRTAIKARTKKGRS